MQKADTQQLALGFAKSDQNAVNCNAPQSIAGGNISDGPSTATQTARSSADADVSNKAKTDQDQSLPQDLGSSGCHAGCGGAGGFQAGIQMADTKQLALGFAKSDQNAVNGNAPHSMAGGNISDGPSSATQTATSAERRRQEQGQDRSGPVGESTALTVGRRRAAGSPRPSVSNGVGSRAAWASSVRPGRAQDVT